MPSLRQTTAFSLLALLTAACATAGDGASSGTEGTTTTANSPVGVGVGVGGSEAGTSTTSSDDAGSTSGAGGTSSTSGSGGDPNTSSSTSGTATSATSGAGGGNPGFCGDGLLDADEQCDDGAKNADSAACTSKCKKAACGDGLLQLGVEQCDDGAKNADSAACTSKCKKALCGDGLLQLGVEQCDDGNLLDGDACSKTCTTVSGPVWTKTYDLFDDFWTGAAVDPNGNVVVVGGSTNAFGDLDVVVRKYDTKGAVLWTKTYDNGGNELANGVAVDAAGNAFVIGYEEDFLGLQSILVRKYGTNGNLVWSQTYGTGFDEGDDVGIGIAVNAAGDAFLAGEVRSDTVSDADRVVAKISGAGGDVVWNEVTDGGIGDDAANAVTVDSAGDVVAVSSVAVAGGKFDAMLRKYKDGATPTILWTKTYGDAIPLAVDTDSKGNVLVAGGDRAGGADYNVWIQKYASNGTLVWTKGYGNAAKLTDAAFGVAVDSKDDVVVCGYEQKLTTNSDMWIRKYDANGNIVWTQGFAGAANDLDEAYGV
ncbi:MAG: DUF4215 domain-containing protein, partial [Deltaproteobacteria bacterium]|nr:DUF4215 domain-containing protein [Deltaproteobacteria bacterium]